MQAWQWVVIAVPTLVLLVSIVMVARIASRMRRSSEGADDASVRGRPEQRSPSRRPAPQRAASDDDDEPAARQTASEHAEHTDHTGRDASYEQPDQISSGRADDGGPAPQRVAGDEGELDLDQSPQAEYARAERAIVEDDPAYGRDLAHLDDQPAEDDTPAEALFRRPESR